MTDHDFSYYVLAPEMANRKQAKYLAVCNDCAEVVYLDEIPEGESTQHQIEGTA